MSVDILKEECRYSSWFHSVEIQRCSRTCPGGIYDISQQLGLKRVENPEEHIRLLTSNEHLFVLGPFGAKTMPKCCLVVWPRIVRFAMRVVETGGVWSKDRSSAKPIGEPVRKNDIVFDIQNLQRGVIGSTLSDGVSQKAAILRDGGNADGCRRARSAQSGVNEDSLLSEESFFHDNRVLLAISLAPQKEGAGADFPKVGDNILIS